MLQRRKTWCTVESTAETSLLAHLHSRPLRLGRFDESPTARVTTAWQMPIPKNIWKANAFSLQLFTEPSERMHTSCSYHSLQDLPRLALHGGNPCLAWQGDFSSTS